MSGKAVGICVLLLLAPPGGEAQEDRRAPEPAAGEQRGPQSLPPDVRRRQSNKRYHEAIQLARKALVADPDAPMMHYALGTLLFAVDDYRGAIVELRAELERSPAHFDSLRKMAAAHTGLGELEASLPYLERCLEQRPEAADVALELGRNLSTLGRLDAAEPYLRRAAEDLRDAGSWVELGVLHRRRGDLEGAAGAFRRALARDAGDPAALFNYGQALILLGRREEGAKILAYHADLATEIDYLERFGQANRLDASVANFLMLARLHRDRQDSDAALEAYLSALELDPGQSAAMIGGAEIHLERSDLERAERWARRAAAIDPGSSRPRFLLGLVKARRGQPRAAETDFELSLSLSAWQVADYLELAAAYRDLGDLERAASALEQAVRLDPRDARGHRELSRTLWLQGEKARALAAVDRAVEIDAGDADAWMLAGIMRLDAGQPAESALRSALEAQTIDLLAAGALQKILDRFADLPAAAPALELYRRLHDER